MLSIQHLSKSYGEKQALNGVNFTIAPGEIVALLGANGSGKTTIIRSICQMLIWDEGEITFNNRNIRNESEYLRHIGAVLDGSRNTHFRLTAMQNAEYFARMRGAKCEKTRQYIRSMHQTLGLDPYLKREVGKLSTGNKQKVALLCALSYQPQLLLLDEPTLGLDMETVAELQKTIAYCAKEHNQGFLITSHDLGFIDQICTRVLVLNEGQIIFNGSIEALKQQLHNYQCHIELTTEQLTALKAQLPTLLPIASEHLQITDTSLTFQYDDINQPFTIITWLEQQSITPQALTITPLSIETAYRSLIQQSEQQNGKQNDQQSKQKSDQQSSTQEVA